MLIAVLSDIHSNVCALREVIADTRAAGASELWVCGDTFGYYPWAADCYEVLSSADLVAVLGNHDHWVCDADLAPAHVAGEIARQNAESLGVRQPAALNWLAELPVIKKFERDGWQITMVHGTPDDPLDGRYYPDDGREYGWLPGAGEILLLGQTHYPILRGNASQGMVLNPGSVGQPRDGNPMPSWALLDLATGQAELRRSSYDYEAAMERLRGCGWNDSVVKALARK